MGFLRQDPLYPEDGMVFLVELPETVKAACACYCLVSSFCSYPDASPGLEFPWGPKPFSEVVAGPLLRNNGQTLDSSALEGSHIGVYFSAHWVSRRCCAEHLEWAQGE